MAKYNTWMAPKRNLHFFSGKTKVIKTWETFKELPPKGHDSILAVGYNGPNEAEDIRLSKSGIIIPAGKIEHREKYVTPAYDEYVIYDEKRISIRYVVRLAGQKPRKIRASRISTKAKPRTNAPRMAIKI